MLYPLSYWSFLPLRVSAKIIADNPAASSGSAAGGCSIRPHKDSLFAAE